METPRIFIISDLHLEHANIMKYCHRDQFEDVHQMNYEMVSRWNQTVGKFDTVYFLGDLVFSRDKGRNIRGWLHKLNGIKIFIWGNHDTYLKCKLPYLVIKFNGEPLLLVHSEDPNGGHNKETLAHTEVCKILTDWKETPWWIIHGHHHNNNLQKHPLINNESRMINVSAELLDYRPIELEKLLAMREC
jgi:calcineurin-like phosphoesterase family protein